MQSFFSFNFRKLTIFFGLILFSSASFASDTDTESVSRTNRAFSGAGSSNAYLPHTPHSGMWTFDYRYSRMAYSGSLKGRNSINPQSVLQTTGYYKLPSSGSQTCPTTITVEQAANDPNCYISNIGNTLNMDKHMFSAKYYQTKDLSWRVMIDYLSNSANMYNKTNSFMPASKFNMSSSGVGDVKVFMTNRVAETHLFDVKFTLGLNLPLGSIDKRDGFRDVTTGKDNIAPYYMQTGSGTYDLITELSLEGYSSGFEYGFIINRIMRTGVNSQFYNMGDIMKINGWGRYTLASGTQLRGGVTQNVWAPIDGRDQRLDYNTRYTGGKRLDLTVGLGQQFKDFGVYAEYDYPVLQYLNGVQMKTTGTINLGLTYYYM